MALGYHYYFSQLVEEPQTYFEYYLTSGWAYWNRKVLLAYETMLRGLAPRFASVTLPYWDAFADFAQVQTTNCTLLDCSIILTDFGGYTGTISNLTIDRNDTRGIKVSTPPLNAFCESDNNASCAGYLIRSSWRRSFPSGFGYFSLASALNSASSFQQFTSVIKSGMHNNMHLALGAMMANNRTTADILFMPLQYVAPVESLALMLCVHSSATFDMVLQVYINCYVGEFPTDAAKRNTSSAWPFVPSTISNPPYAAPTLNSNITIRLPLSSTQLGTFVDATGHPVLGSLFQSLPAAYWQYVSASNIGGVHSYTYDFNSLMSNLTASMYKCVVVREPTITAPPPARRVLRESIGFLSPAYGIRQRSEFRVMTITDRMQREICQNLFNRDLCTRLLHYIECAWTVATMGDDPIQRGTFSGGVGADANQKLVSPCTDALQSREAMFYNSSIARGVDVLTRLLTA
ncbi:hypothetical protein DYB32_010590 [Aphanomyces invadans]|uniref:Tyrosinase copper-binding domain-containing protein n=1 Tax=Aphanomyces invadans TaxID=157072 RepID=A0A3R6YR15_9STRA|nr:hypothetical protein DYB32_010590 [Aphanomyces invadans]